MKMHECVILFFIVFVAYLALNSLQAITDPVLQEVNVTETQDPEVFTKWKVTAYCSKNCCCGDFANGVTANGHSIQPGDKFVAAPKRFPFGTMLMIPGYGTVPVLDRGGAIKGNKIDVYFGDTGTKGDTNYVSGHQRALNWGVKYFDNLELVR